MNNKINEIEVIGAEIIHPRSLKNRPVVICIDDIEEVKKLEEKVFPVDTETRKN